MKKPALALLIGAATLFSQMGFAHKGITFQGVIKLPDSTYPNLPGITVNAKVLSPNNCILLEEEFTSVNINRGYINLVIGKGNRTGADTGLSLSQVMDNSKTINALTCLDNDGNVTGNNFYDPSTGTGSRKFRLTVNSLSIIADFNMRAVPFAINSETLNGKTATDFLAVSPAVNQNALENLVSNIADIALSGSASDLASGTVHTARLGTGTASASTYLRGDGTWATISSSVSSVNGLSGAVVLRPSHLKAVGGGNAFIESDCDADQALNYISADDTFVCQDIALSTADITSGTLPLARGGTGATTAADARTSLGLATIASSGSASDLTAGTVPVERLGTGTASASTYLRGDGAWATLSGGGGVPLAIAGSTSAPDIHIAGRTTSGIYGDPGPNGPGSMLGITIGGANHTEFNNEYINSYRKVSTANGSVTQPHYTFMGDSDTGVYHYGANAIGFSTQGTYRAQINNNGLTVVGTVLPSTNGGGSIGTGAMRWGTAYFANAIDESSDLRLKEKIEESDLGLDFIMALEPVSWHWKEGKGDKTRHYGLIAQKTQQTVQSFSNYPETKDSIIVGYHKESDTYGIRYSELIAPVIKAIQELVARVLGVEENHQNLTAEVEQLKQQNRVAQEKIQQLELNYQSLLQKIEELK